MKLLFGILLIFMLKERINAEGQCTKFRLYTTTVSMVLT